MRHFDLNEWTTYTKGLTKEEVRERMESHLLTCEECLNIYLSAIEKSQDQQEKVLASPNFTDQVMTKIYQKVTPKGRENKYGYSSKMLFYYAAAACITIILTFSGTFQFLSDNVLSSTVRITESSVGIEEKLVNGWPEQIVTKTINLMDNIKLKHFKE